MKKIFTLLMMLICVSMVMAQIPTNGLMAYYPFNGNANDGSTNGINGTVNGATLCADRFGNTSSAYSFNGTTNNISFSSVPTTNIDNYSISIWLSSANISQGTAAILIGNDDAKTMSTSNGYGIGISDGVTYGNGAKISCLFSGSAPTSVLNSGTSVTSNQWYHVVLVRNSGSSKFYINNVASVNTSTTTPKAPTKFFIGSQNGCRYFNGKIDDIRIYNRALNETEISALFNEGVCNATKNVTDTLFISANLTGFNPITYQNNIKIYPNPTSNTITIDCGSNYSTLNGYTIKISNNLSQTIYTSPVTKQTETIDLKSWTGKGIYFIQLIDGNQNIIENKKIVLQ